MVKKKREVYLDYAAATPIDQKVFLKMRPFFDLHFGNPRSVHLMGSRAKKEVENARRKVAGVLGVKKEEIIFTSGGTESNNMTILGVARFFKKNKKIKKPHIIASSIEHSSVYEPLETLKKEGFDVTFIPIDGTGVVRVKDVKNNIKKETILVSIMYVNNEIGTIQPLRSIGNFIKEFREKNKKEYPYFHTDASQAPRYLPLIATTLGVDFLVIDGAKMYGPKSIGAFYKKEGISITPIMWGGGQEDHLRPGTENVPGIVGLSESLVLASKNRKENEKRLQTLKDYFIRKVTKEIECAKINGDPKKSVSGIVNVMFVGHTGEKLMVFLEDRGIYVTTSSACSTGEDEPSHVIIALGENKNDAKSSVRFSFGNSTTKSDLDFTVKVIKEAIHKSLTAGLK